MGEVHLNPCRTTRAAARFETGSAADNGEMMWRGAGGRSIGAGTAAAAAGAAEELSLLHDGSNSVASGAGQHGSPLARPRYTSAHKSCF